jgi:acyl-CoA synthetase (AMP-forming)/AMP-acid ligase II
MPASVYVPSHLESLPTDSDALRSLQAVSACQVSADDDSSLQTVDGLLRRRALLHPQTHAISYPSSGTTFVDYTLQQLDVFAWRVAKHYETKLPVRSTSVEKPRVVAMLGPSNLEYLITMLALSKLGHTVLLLSTRIPQLAIESLVNTTGATAIVAEARHLEVVGKVQESIPGLDILEIAGRSMFEFVIEAHGDTQMDSALDGMIETQNIAFIIHSSGQLTHSLIKYTQVLTEYV